jgi:hypothetical protein
VAARREARARLRRRNRRGGRGRLDHLRTPETYLGYWRSEHFASPDGAAFDERHPYTLPEHLRLNHWAVAGEWTIGAENVVLDHEAARPRTLEITFLEPGAEAYAFTFG